MRRTALAMLLLGSVGLRADIIPTLTGITAQADGTFLYSYSASIAADQQLKPASSNFDASLTATSGRFQDALFLLNFGNLVYDAMHPVTSPTGWGANILMGGTLVQTYGQNSPANAAQPEIEFYDYTAPALTGPATLCCFSAYSHTGTGQLGYYDGQGTKYAPGLPTEGTIQGNSGRVVTPSAIGSVPEPTTMFTLGGSLLGLGLFRRRYRSN